MHLVEVSCLVGDIGPCTIRALFLQPNRVVQATDTAIEFGAHTDLFNEFSLKLALAKASLLHQVVKLDLTMAIENAGRRNLHGVERLHSGQPFEQETFGQE